ncbi:uncharacterized protein LOC106872506 [Octopus bimaculoides]|uniref:Uncharacterized protein n=1 Tax=Octopus bimaculoides TaxID=37653 RepID=A0A0L8H6N6_OCTBM|nr:uncharacterized protein LOC106872506 [Octopus bimaculoides]|eukprot:XP_014775009.1 PREDICTED: uncharacterized protein LOC106872506 [Octopus bimaculoides]
MMKIVYTVCYLALIFSLGACTVTDIEPQINEEDIVDFRAILKDVIKKLDVDRMFDNYVADIGPLNFPKTGDIQKVQALECSWKGASGRCCAKLTRAPRLCLRIKLSSGEIAIQIRLYLFTIFSEKIHGAGTKTFYFPFGPLKYWLTVSVKSITDHFANACFSLKYKVFRIVRNESLGCFSKKF